VKTGRIEAFSDGVIAVIITIMVLEVKAPRGIELTAIGPLLPTFLAYVLSFVYVGIYWITTIISSRSRAGSTAARCSRTCTASSGSP